MLRGHIVCQRGGRRRVLSHYMQRLRGFRGLTSGSARWLTSRVTSHAAGAGLRLSRERTTRPGHVPVSDPYSC
jgi:hypothetical protein